MRGSDVASAWRRGLALLAAGSLILLPQSVRTSDRESPASASQVTIDSEPGGAAVYIDGRFAGATPVAPTRLSPGDHRVRVVKAGYLENSRVVAIRAHEGTTVRIKLTPDANTSLSAQVTPVGGGGGGSGRKLLWIGLAGAAAGGAAAYVVATKNHAPSAGTITVSPNATGMAGLTSFVFTSSATDPDNDSLTYAWNFGDGSTGSGAAPTHVYSGPGTFPVSVAVSDGKQTVNPPNASVTVGPSVTGTWTGGNQVSVTGAPCPTTLSLTQTNTSLAGTLTWSGGCFGSVTLSTSSVAALQHPTAVSLLTNVFSWTSGNSVFQNLQLRFAGTTNASGTTLTGTFTLTQSGSTSNTNATTFAKQ